MPADDKLPTLGLLNVGSDFSLDLDYFLTQAYDDIGQASSELPAVIEWVNMKLQEVIESRLIAKQKIKEVEATIYFELKGGTFIERYAEKMTEAAVTNAVALDPRVTEAHSGFAVLSGWVTRLSNLQYSLTAKLDLTRSVEATRRQLIGRQEDPE